MLDFLTEMKKGDQCFFVFFNLFFVCFGGLISDQVKLVMVLNEIGMY